MKRPTRFPSGTTGFLGGMLALCTPNTSLAQAEGSAEKVPALAGNWAQVQVTSSLVDVPLMGKSEVQTRSIALLHIEQEASALSIREQVCSLETDPTFGGLVRTEYPQSFVDALSVNSRRADLRWDNGTWRYAESRSYRFEGARLRAPGTERLPSHPADPRVADPDHDGKPGLTVRVKGLVSGEVYMVQRGWSELKGTLLSPRQIEGQVSWDAETKVLGASKRLLNKDPKSRPHPSEQKSFFKMIRWPGKATCHSLCQHAAFDCRRS